MDLYKYLCFILLTMVCYIDAIYILTENKYNWSEATQLCTLATPNLNFTANGTTPDLDNLPIVDAWLGYTEKMTPFEYFGCAKKIDLKLNTANFTTEGDPGKCWSACKTAEEVAVYRNECYCLQAVIVRGNKVLNDKCNKGCPSQPNIACGGVTNNSMHEHVSLYKTTYTEPTKASELENSICLWYEKSPASFMWGNCTLDYRMICYNGHRTWVYNGSIAYDDWITMTTQCFNNGGIPSNYNNTKNFNTSETGQMWTGIIRNGVIYQVTDHTNVIEGKYGYVNITTGQLLFTTDNAVRKRALCVKGITNTQGNTDENTTGNGEMLEKGSSDVGAIVGATVAIIIVIIVVIVLIVLWKRGIKFPLKKARKLENEKKQATNMTYSFARPDNTIQGADETSFTNYAEVDVSKMTLGGEVKQNGDTNRTSCSSDEPHTYFVLEKVDQGPYDKTKTTSQIHDQHTFNPYNKISIEESSNYDHIGAQRF